MKISLYIFVLYIHTCYTEIPEIKDDDTKKSARIIFNITEDIIKDTNRRIGLLHHEQKEASGCAAFEVGYLTYVIHEKYRRMVDKYNVSKYMMTRLYLTELVLYLEEIEHHYWEINHISNMLHEVERKYHIEPDFDVEYLESTLGPEAAPTGPGQDEEEGNRKDRMRSTGRYSKKKTRFKMDKYLQEQLTSTMRTLKKKNKFWPIDYGWEPEQQWWPNDWMQWWKAWDD